MGVCEQGVSEERKCVKSFWRVSEDLSKVATSWCAVEVPAAERGREKWFHGGTGKRKILEYPKFASVCGFVCCLELGTCCCRVGSHPRRIPEFGLEADLFWELLLHPEQTSGKLAQLESFTRT